MLSIIDKIIIISLFCCGWCKLISQGMILEKIGLWLSELPTWINKPLGGCVPCSASIIGTIGYILLVQYEYNFIENIFICISCVNLNILIWFLSEYIVLNVKKLRDGK